VSSGGVIELKGGAAYIANLAGSNGSLTIGPGGTFKVTEAPQTAFYLLNIGGNSSAIGASGTVTVQGAGALLDLNNNPASIGMAGTGTLNVLAGGVAKFGTSDANLISALAVGRQVGSLGQIMVDGTGSQLIITGGSYMGRAGTASLTIQNGGNYHDIGTSTGLNFGSGGQVNGVRATGGTASVLVQGVGSTLATDGYLSLGTNGSTGSLQVKSGGTVTFGIANVGNGSTYTGGDGSLQVQAGGTFLGTAAADVTGFHFYVGRNVATTGTVSVTGVGALLDIGANGAAIGYAGTGTLNVAGGGVFKSSSANAAQLSALAVGRNAGAAGTVTVDGAGSQLLIGAGFYIGRGGTGQRCRADRQAQTSSSSGMAIRWIL
jgi:T5SS/PEP-CTERM-associated repeat protein